MLGRGRGLSNTVRNEPQQRPGVRFERSSGAASDDDSQFSSGRRVHMDSDRRLVVNARGGGDSRRVNWNDENDIRRDRGPHGSRGGGDDGNACGIPADWDPMRADFEDPDFNCYDRGPGSDLPRGCFTNRQTKQTRNIQRTKIFIGGIPNGLDKTGLEGLFGRYGSVRSVKLINKPETGQSFAFVEYKTLTEAMAAIADAPEGLNNFQISGRWLKVNFAREKKQDEEMFELRSGGDRQRARGHESDTEQRTNNETRRGDRRLVTDPARGSYSADCESGGSEQRGRGQTREGGSRERTKSLPPGAAGPHCCLFCGAKGATKRCSECKQHYCSRECQTRDWRERNHKARCLKKESQPESDQAAFDQRFQTECDFLPSKLKRNRTHSAKVRPSRKDMTASSLPTDSPVEVCLTHFDDPQQFYVVRRADERFIESLQKDLNKTDGENDSAQKYMPQLGEICTARSEMFGEWYRAEVAAINLDASVVVRFIDYGNTEEIHATSLKKLKAHLEALPIKAVKCKLDVVKNDSWTAQELDELKKVLSVDQIYTATVVREEDQVTCVRLTNSDGIDVAEYLETILLRTQEEETKESPETLNQNVSHGQRATEKASRVRFETPQNFAKCADQELPEVPKDQPSTSRSFYDGKEIKIEVLEIDHPAQWWIRVVDDDQSTELSTLQEAMNNHYSKLKEKKDYRRTAKNLVACRYEVDDNWYRARVIDFNTQNLTVRYLDFGNVEIVPFTYIQSLESTHTSLPWQAVPIALVGVQAKGGQWETDAVPFLVNKIKDKELIARVVQSDKYSAVLDVLSEDKRSLSKLLMEAGYAEELNSSNNSSMRIQGRICNNHADTTQRSMINQGMSRQPPGPSLQPTGGSHRSQTTRQSSKSRPEFRGSRQPHENTRRSDMNAQRRLGYDSDASDRSNRSSRQQQSRISVADRQRSDGRVFKNDRNVQKMCIGDLKPPKIPEAKGFIPMRITEVFEREFYIQVLTEENESLISEMEHGLEKLNEIKEDPGYIREGNLVCAKFDDGKWYRAEVLEVLRSYKIMVRFTDYGNKQCTSKETLSPFHISLSTFPVFGVRCALHGVSENYQNVLGSFLLTRLNMKICDGVTKQDKDTIYIQDLVHPTTKESIISSYLQTNKPDTSREEQSTPSGGRGVTGRAKFRSSSSPQKSEAVSSSPTSKSPVGLHQTKAGFHQFKPAEAASSAPTPRSPPVVQPMSKEPATNLFSYKGPNRRLLRPSSALTTPPMKDDLKHPCLNVGSTYRVALTDATSPNDFTVQLYFKETTEDLSLVTQKLETLGEAYSGSYVPKKTGELVCGKFREDNKWYRAEVLNIEENSAQVRFLDFGNVDICEASSLMSMPKDISLIPVCAVNCSLKDVQLVEEWKAEYIAHVSDEAELHEMTVLEQIQNKYIVDLMRGTSGDSFTTRLINAGVLRSTNQDVGQDSTGKMGVKAIVSDALSVCKLPKQEEVQVAVWHINSPTSFYVQCYEDQDLIDKFSEMSLEISECEEDEKVLHVESGELCAAKSSDGSWYRAKALNVYSSSVEVYFIDYGNCEEVPSDDVKELPDRFRKLPVQAIHCGLHGISGTKKDGSYSEEALEWFSQEGMKLQTLANISHQGRDNGKYKVTEIKRKMDDADEDSTSVLDRMIAANHARENIDAAGQETNKAQAKITVNPAYSDLPKITLRKTRDVDVVVNTITDPGHFYVTLSEQVNRLSEFECAVKDHCSKQEPDPDLELKAGDICCALSQDPEYEGWYRAVVLNVLDSAYRVLYFDYGNTEEVPLQLMRRISQALMIEPPFAIRCNLAGLKPNGDTYSKDAFVAFHKTVEGKLSTVEFREKYQDTKSPIGEIVHSVLLTTKGSDVAQGLIQKKLAQADVEGIVFEEEDEEMEDRIRSTLATRGRHTINSEREPLRESPEASDAAQEGESEVELLRAMNEALRKQLRDMAKKLSDNMINNRK